VKTRQDQTTFQAGEIDPLAAGRFDIKNYYAGAASLRNVRSLLAGGVRRRPGTRYVTTLPDLNARLEDFTFKDSQAYLLVFLAGRLQVYLTDGTLAQDTAGLAWTTTAQLAQMTIAQRGDTILVCHKDFPMQEIRRTGPTTFTIAAYVFLSSLAGDQRYQPYYKFADPAVTVTPSATTGAIVLTFSAAVCDALDVNTIFRVGKKEVLITSLVDSSHLNATVRQTLAGTTATQDWDEAIFSPRRGYPRSACFHENRLVIGGSRDFPAGLWLSQSGGYYNFDLGTNKDNEGIWTAVGAEATAEIRNVVSFRNLLVFTDEGEFNIPTSIDKPITPTNVIIRQQTPYGSASVRPQPYDGAVMFVQKTGLAIREAVYDDLEKSYTGYSISSLASHLIKTPVDMAVLDGTADYPENYLFVVMSDGSMAVLFSNRAEQQIGWMPWDTPGGNGKFRNAAVVLDLAFFAVERTINGVTKLCLEVLDPTIYLDCAVTKTGAEASFWPAAAPHLVGEKVWTMSGNAALAETTVALAGDVVAPSAVTSLTVGYTFTPTIVPMPFQLKGGTANSAFVTNVPRRVVRATAVVDQTLRFLVNRTAFEVRQAGDLIEVAPPPLTGRYDFRGLGWDKAGQVTITQDVPGPMTLLALEMEVSIGA
jgi:hypothetical protein